jgi:hypothetical protein
MTVWVEQTDLENLRVHRCRLKLNRFVRGFDTHKNFPLDKPETEA